MSNNDFDGWRERCAPEILGESRTLLDALELVRRVGPCDASVLIQGETGVGKELFARVVHRSSPRASRPFVAVNCAAIPESLIESELFGHVRGAFTGAASARAGRFVAAQGGTIFLDEIGDLPLAAQAKLLRVLEQRAVCPVGADVEQQVDVRIVAATHRNLQEMVEQKLFRADLYFRLSVVPVSVPPLRERAEDAVLLAESAIRRLRGATSSEPLTLDASASAALREHAWPGNVRELLHVVERAIILANGPALTAKDLRLAATPSAGPKLARGTMPQLAVVDRRPAPVPSTVPVAIESETSAPVAEASDTFALLDLRSALEGLERRMIRDALERARGNRTQAAALLGLNRTTLVEKLRKYG